MASRFDIRLLGLLDSDGKYQPKEQATTKLGALQTTCTLAEVFVSVPLPQLHTKRESDISACLRFAAGVEAGGQSRPDLERGGMFTIVHVWRMKDCVGGLGLISRMSGE